jgi:HAMP domain-containing protein
MKARGFGLRDESLRYRLPVWRLGAPVPASTSPSDRMKASGLARGRRRVVCPLIRIERLRDPMIEVDYSDRLTAADEIERLRKAVRHDSESLEDQPASPEHDDAGDDTPSIDPELFAELKTFAEALPPNRIGDQANRIDELEAEIARRGIVESNRNH